MNDKQLRQDVIDELDFEPSIDAAHIGVAAEKGVVTLSGHVVSYAHKLAAAQVARRVNGVRAVAQEIEVRFPEDKKSADDQIAKRAMDILAWDALVPGTSVTPTVQNGWITLNGNVQWHFQRRAAEDAVRRLSGVRGVINSLTLASAPALQVEEVRRKIEGALGRHALVESEQVRVSVRNGSHVVLEGTVDNWDERFAVESAAWSVAGVTDVEDNLTIEK